MEHEEQDIDDPSPIIQLFERVSFERGHEVHDQVASMVELFSSADVCLPWSSSRLAGKGFRAF